MRSTVFFPVFSNSNVCLAFLLPGFRAYVEVEVNHALYNVPITKPVFSNSLAIRYIFGTSSLEGRLLEKRGEDIWP